MQPIENFPKRVCGSVLCRGGSAPFPVSGALYAYDASSLAGAASARRAERRGGDRFGGLTFESPFGLAGGLGTDRTACGCFPGECLSGASSGNISPRFGLDLVGAVAAPGGIYLVDL